MSLINVEKHPDCKYCQQSRNIWDFIQKIFVITLKDRLDRQKLTLEELHRTGACQNAQLYAVERSTKGFVHGCWTSHVEVCQHALQQGYETIMVFEDDFLFDTDTDPKQIAQEVAQALKPLPQGKWTKLSLGDYSWFALPYAKGVKRSSSCLTHAQIWSTKGMKWMVDHPFEGRGSNFLQLDGYLSIALPHAYSLTPARVFQRKTVSDNTMTPGNDSVTQHNIQIGEILIPVAYVVGLTLFTVLTTLLLIKFRGVRWWVALLFSISIFFVPFAIVWVLFLANAF